MINNLELIKPLLQFEKDGDFYMLYIFKRKKDQVDKENHQSVRTIKTYCVESVEYLDKKWPEITHLCEHFKARAYIHVQKQNHKDVGLEMMVELASKIRDGVHNFKNLFDSVVGKLKYHNKAWIVDIDTNDEEYIKTVIGMIDSIRPLDFPTKIITQVPTKSGVHLITQPFDISEFNWALSLLGLTLPDIQKKNPTLLYLPDSLH